MTFKEYQAKLREYLDLERYPAATGLIDERLQAEPNNYELYLDRARVSSLRDQAEQSIKDNDAARRIFEKRQYEFLPDERNVRLAELFLSEAATFYMAEIKAKDEAQKRAYDEKLMEVLQRAKSQDESMYLNILSALGLQIEPMPATSQQVRPQAASQSKPKVTKKGSGTAKKAKAKSSKKAQRKKKAKSSGR